MLKRANKTVKQRAYQKAERAGKLAELLICLRYFFMAIACFIGAIAQRLGKLTL